MKNVSFSILLLIITCFTISSYSQCTRFETIQTEATECIINGDQRTCSKLINIDLIIPFPDQTVCILITDPEDRTVGQLEVSLLEMRATVVVARKYLTAEYSLLTQSQRQCAGTTGCKQFTSCDAFDRDDFNYPALFQENQVNLPGIADCESVCGGFDCGCLFAVANACLLYDYGVNPLGDTIAQVDSPTAVIYQPIVEVCLSGTCGTMEANNLPTAVPNFEGIFTTQIIGNLAGNTVVFNGRDFIFNKDGTFLHGSSSAGNPVANTIGDIQGNTFVSLSNPTTSSFIYDTNMITPIPGSFAVSYQATPSGLNALGLASKLPLSLGSLQLDSTQTSIIGSDADPGATIVRFKSNVPMTFSSTIELICPVITFISVDGCHSCIEGVLLKVLIHSTCAGGTIQMVSSDVTLESSAIVITTSPVERDIKLFTTSRDNPDVEIDFIGEPDTVTFTFSVIASDPVTIENRTEVNQTDVAVTGDFVFPDIIDPTSDIWGWLTQWFTADALGFWITIAIGVAVSIAITITLCVVFRA